MCINRFSVDTNSFEYKGWLKALHNEDIKQFGEIVKRPQSALDLLFSLYKRSYIKR